MGSTNRLVSGMGINDISSPVTINKNSKQVWICPIYSRWKCLLERLNPSNWESKYSHYAGCTLVEEWLLFSNFKQWIEPKIVCDKLELDKDIIIKDNKIYGPEYCTLVPQRINKIFLEYSQTSLPLGVIYQKESKDMKNPLNKPYRACVNNGLKRLSLGMFSNPEDAHKAWQKAKILILKEVIDWWRLGEFCKSFDHRASAAILQRAYEIETSLHLGIITEKI